MAIRKKVVAKKKTATKKEGATKRKVVGKKRTVVKKKITTKGKVTTRKKASAKKGSTAKSKVATNKKTAARKKVTTKKKASTKRKTAIGKKKIGTKKKSAIRKRSTAKKKVTNKKRTVKKTTITSTGLILGSIKPYKSKKSEGYMGMKQQQHFMNILQLWKEQLLEKNYDTLNHIHDEVTNLPDQNDRATLEEEFSLELRTRDREWKLIKKIEKSIMELEKGKLSNYGYCESCGAGIGIPRLEARPTADLCIDCKELDEIREKSMA